MKRLIVFLSLLVLCGCARQYSDFFPYSDDGTPKPNVALIPVIDSCHPSLSWDFAKEVSDSLRNELMKHGKIYCPREPEIQKQMQCCSKKEITSMKDQMPCLFFQPAHFVVVLELIEFKDVPYVPGQIKPVYLMNLTHDDCIVLMMKMRCKIVDIRGGEPKVVRQEIVESNHVMPKADFEEAILSHDRDGFKASTLGLAEGRFVSDLAAKIEKITCYQNS
jgi:hypothetical protein